MVEKVSGVEVVLRRAANRRSPGSRRQVHIAGSHLHDPGTGEFNLPYLRREFEEDFRVVTYAWWEEGLVVAKGNRSAFTTSKI
jgi:molybdate-binding protein